MAEDTYTVIRDVSTSLKAILKANIPELADDNYISFGSPADIDTSIVKLSMYLYYICESPSMRNSEMTPVDEIDQFLYPPAYLDLYYLMTPYGKDRDTELLVLGRAFQLFHDQQILRGDNLKGNLIACGNEEIRISYNNLTLQDIKHLWEGFPGKSTKLCLSYLVSPVRLPAERSITIPRVQSRGLRIDQI